MTWISIQRYSYFFFCRNDDSDAMAQATIVCDLCDSPRNTKYYCTKCEASICDVCKGRHEKEPVFKDHVIRDRIDVMAPIGSLCRHHAPKEIINRCKTCNVAVGSACIQSLHKGQKLAVYKKEDQRCVLL